MEVATRSNVYSKQEMEMVDLSDKGSSESEETNSGQTPDRVSSEGDSHVKTCADCGTTKTPLWRGGPSGPKSLCNACGIRSRKKRRALLGMNKEDKKSKKSTKGQHSNNRNSSISISSSSNNKVGNSVRRKLIAIPREASFQRPRPASNSVAKQWKRLGEEEEAAFLLMALSCGSVLA